MNYYVKIENNDITGFFAEEIHGKDECIKVLSDNGIIIDEMLWNYILQNDLMRFNKTKTKSIYTIEDKDMFTKIPVVIKLDEIKPTHEERISKLESMLSELLSK